MALGAGSLFGGQLGNRRGRVRLDDNVFRHFGYSALSLCVVQVGLGGVGHVSFALRILGCHPNRSSPTCETQPRETRNRHNPIGGWASVFIVLLVGLQASSGLFISDDIFYAGPYNTVVSTSTADWLAGWHHRLFTLIQVAVLMHVLAVSWYTWGKGGPDSSHVSREETAERRKQSEEEELSGTARTATFDHCRCLSRDTGIRRTHAGILNY